MTGFASAENVFVTPLQSIEFVVTWLPLLLHANNKANTGAAIKALFTILNSDWVFFHTVY